MMYESGTLRAMRHAPLTIGCWLKATFVLMKFASACESGGYLPRICCGSGNVSPSAFTRKGGDGLDRRSSTVYGSMARTELVRIKPKSLLFPDMSPGLSPNSNEKTTSLAVSGAPSDHRAFRRRCRT